MADNLQPAGVRAIIQDLNEYLRGADQMNRATAGIGQAAQNAAGQTNSAAGGIDKFGNSLNNAGKSSDGFTAHLGQVSNAVSGLLLKLAPVGAAIAGAFGLAKGIQALDNLGASIFRLQQTTNLTAEQASKLKFVFEESGVEANAGERAIIKFSRALGGVADLEDGIAIPTGKKMAEQLYQLGIRTEDATGKQRPLTEVLADLADQFQKLPDGVEKTTLATNLFGRNGKDLIPVLNQGRAGIEAMGEEAGKLGLVLDQKTTDAIRKNSLAQKEFHAALTGISVQIGLALLPAMTLLITVGTKLAVVFNEHIVKGIQIVSGVINYGLSAAIRGTAPLLAGLAAGLNKIKDVVTSGFGKGFVTGSAFSGIEDVSRRLKPFAAVAAFLGASFRQAFENFRLLFNLLRIGANIVRAFVSDYTNILRVTQFLPKPLQVVGIELFNLIRHIIDLTGAFLGFGQKVDAATGGPLGKLRDIFSKIDEVIPIAGAALTAFIAALAVGVVLGFVQAIVTMVTAFGNLSVVKFATGLVKDFITALLKPVKLIVDLAGDALQGIGKIGSFILDTAGKVLSFTVNAVGNALEFIQNLVGGAIQRLLDASPLHQKVILEQATAPGVTGVPGGPHGPVQVKPPAGLLTQLLDQIKRLFTGQFFSGVGGVLLGALIESKTSVIGLLTGPFRFFGSRLAGLFNTEGALGFSRALDLTVIGTLILSAIVGAIQLATGDIREGIVTLLSPIVGGGLGAAIGAGIGLLGGPLAPITVPAGAAAGAAIGVVVGAFGGAIYNAFRHPIDNIFLRVAGLFTEGFKRLPGLIATGLVDLAGLFGKVLGGLGAAIAIGLILGLIVLPALLFKELGKLRGKINEVGRLLGREAFELGTTVVKAIISGLAFLHDDLPRIIVDAFLSVVRGIPGFFTQRVIPAFREAFTGVLAVFKDPTLIIDGIRALIRLIGELFTKGIPAALHDLGALIKNAAMAAFGLLPGIVKGYIGLVIDEIVAFGLGVFNEFKHVWESANEISNGQLNEIRGNIQDKLSTIGDTIKRAFETTLDIVTGVMGRIRDAAVGGWDFIVAGVKGAVSGLGAIVGGVFDHAADALVTSIAFVAHKVADIINKVTDVLSALHFGDNPYGLNTLRDILNSIGGGGGTAGGQAQPGSELPGGFAHLASGTRRPLRTATTALVGEGGTELALLPRGRAVLPVGSEVLNASASGRLLSLLQGLPALAGAVTGNNYSYALNMPVDARGMSFEQMRALLHSELDRQLISSRSRATRAGASLSSAIG